MWLIAARHPRYRAASPPNASIWPLPSRNLTSGGQAVYLTFSTCVWWELAVSERDMGGIFRITRVWKIQLDFGLPLGPHTARVVAWYVQLCWAGMRSEVWGYLPPQTQTASFFPQSLHQGQEDRTGVVLRRSVSGRYQLLGTSAIS